MYLVFQFTKVVRKFTIKNNPEIMKHKIKIYSSERRLSSKSCCQGSVLQHRNNNLKNARKQWHWDDDLFLIGKKQTLASPNFYEDGLCYLGDTNDCS